MSSSEMGFKPYDLMGDVFKMNRMYSLPVNVVPTTQLLKEDPLQRLKNFRITLQNEINELDDIIAKFDSQSEIDNLVDISDLFTDVSVYCASESLKFGIPFLRVFEIVMQSNFSKLGADGLPIKNAQGKVEKGPNYWKPEPKIKQLLLSYQGVQK